MKKDYDSTRIYRNTQKKGASQTYDTPSCILSSCLYGVFPINIEIGMCMIGVVVLLFKFERVFDAGHFFYKCLINFQTLVYRIATVNDR